MNVQRNALGFPYIATTVAINAAALILCSTSSAAKAPLSVEDLSKNSDVIVVGSIEHIRIESEPSRIAPRIGNSDWAVILTLAVDNVENGILFENKIEARCTRVRSRRSMLERICLTGHQPIPEEGVRVRAYLAKEKGSWAVVMPNGITRVDDDVNSQSLKDAGVVAELGSPRFTFILPLEIWIFAACLAIPVFVGLRLFRRRRMRQDVRAKEFSNQVLAGGTG